MLRVSLALLTAHLIPATASATLLVGYHSFSEIHPADQTPDVGPGFSGVSSRIVTTALQTPEQFGGSSDGTYGDLVSPTVPSFTPGVPGTGDGHLRIQNNSPAPESRATLVVDNVAGQDIEFTSLLFDVAFRDDPATTLIVEYEINDVYQGDLFNSSPTTQVVGLSASSPQDFQDVAIDLGLLPVLAVGSTIEFIFRVGSVGSGATANETIRLDNIALTAIPETSGVLALSCLMISGLLYRRRQPTVPTTA